MLSYYKDSYKGLEYNQEEITFSFDTNICESFQVFFFNNFANFILLSIKVSLV